MTVTIQDVMRHVRNHFVTGSVEGEWQTRDGLLSPAAFRPGEWIAITGADAPCGVYQLDEYGAIPGAVDAAWSGRICLLSPPEDFLRLCREIADWAKAHTDPTLTGERFGEYSRSMEPGGWTTVFAAALAPYTRMYPEVNA